jgi:hypothetical protein
LYHRLVFTNAPGIPSRLTAAKPRPNGTFRRFSRTSVRPPRVR